jgi:hypothetical protein
MWRVLLVVVAISTVGSCTTKVPKIKSPCVAHDNGGSAHNPCIKRPANTWLA